MNGKRRAVITSPCSPNQKRVLTALQRSTKFLCCSWTNCGIKLWAVVVSVLFFQLCSKHYEIFLRIFMNSEQFGQLSYWWSCNTVTICRFSKNHQNLCTAGVAPDVSEIWNFGVSKLANMGTWMVAKNHAQLLADIRSDCLNLARILFLLSRTICTLFHM